jgi:hypothetical protein
MHRNPLFCSPIWDAVYQQGEERHVMCPHYDLCLEEAVRRNQHFSCRACDFWKHDIRAYKVHDGIED